MFKYFCFKEGEFVHVKIEEHRASNFYCPTMPYIIDDDVCISGKFATAKYVARKCGLVISDTKALARQDTLEDMLSKLQDQFEQSTEKEQGAAINKCHC